MLLDSFFGIDVFGEGNPDFLDDAVIMDMIEEDEEEEVIIPAILEEEEENL